MAKSPSRKPLYPPNAGMFERIEAYIDAGLFKQAQTLVHIGNSLEADFHWNKTKMKRR